jgi:hypothetical protein
LQKIKNKNLKIIFYNRFLIPTVILEFEYILIFKNKNITNYLNNLILYIDKIDLKSGKELQLITKSRRKYLL